MDEKFAWIVNNVKITMIIERIGEKEDIPCPECQQALEVQVSTNCSEYCKQCGYSRTDTYHERSK